MHHDGTFNFGYAKVCCLPYLRHVSLMTTIDGLLKLIILCTLVVLFPLTAILQLINFRAS